MGKLLPADCEVRTVTVDVGLPEPERVTGFCFGDLATYCGPSEHWRILHVASGLVIAGTFFHNIDDACAAMGELNAFGWSVSSPLPTSEMIMVFNILTTYNVCLTMLRQDIEDIRGRLH